MAGRQLVRDKLEDIYESLIKKKYIGREEVNYSDIIDAGSLINKLFMQSYLIFKTDISYSEKVDAIHGLKDNEGKLIFNNKAVAEWFVGQFNDNTVKFMDTIFSAATNDLKGNHTGGNPVKIDTSGMGKSENEPGMYGDIIDTWMSKIGVSSGPNMVLEFGNVVDNIQETNKSLYKFSGMSALFDEADENASPNEIVKALTTAVTMAPDLFMKFKNFADLFIYLPHTFENVLCKFGSPICHTPLDMISWIITHMNIAAKPFLVSGPLVTDLMSATASTFAVAAMAPPFTPIGMAAMSVSAAANSLPGVIVKKTFDHVIAHAGDLTLFFLALGRKQYAPALAHAMASFPAAGEILRSNQVGLHHAVKWAWRLSSFNRYFADGIRFADLITNVPPITEPVQLAKQMWDNSMNCMYQAPVIKDYYTEMCAEPDPNNPNESKCGRCGGKKPVVFTKSQPPEYSPPPPQYEEQAEEEEEEDEPEESIQGQDNKKRSRFGNMYSAGRNPAKLAMGGKKTHGSSMDSTRAMGKAVSNLAGKIPRKWGPFSRKKPKVEGEGEASTEKKKKSGLGLGLLDTDFHIPLSAQLKMVKGISNAVPFL